MGSCSSIIKATYLFFKYRPTFPLTALLSVFIKKSTPSVTQVSIEVTNQGFFLRHCELNKLLKCSWVVFTYFTTAALFLLCCGSGRSILLCSTDAAYKYADLWNAKSAKMLLCSRVMSTCHDERSLDRTLERFRERSHERSFECSPIPPKCYCALE